MLNVPVAQKKVKIHIGSLPKNALKEHLLEYFRQFDSQVRVHMRLAVLGSEFSDQTNEGFCKVEVTSNDIAEKIFASCPLYFQGRKLKCVRDIKRPAELRSANQYNNRKRIMIKNIDSQSTIQEIADNLSRYGTVINCFFVSKGRAAADQFAEKSNSGSKYYGKPQTVNVEYETPESVDALIHENEGKIRIGSRTATIERFVPKPRRVASFNFQRPAVIRQGSRQDRLAKTTITYRDNIWDITGPKKGIVNIPSGSDVLQMIKEGWSSSHSEDETARVSHYKPTARSYHTSKFASWPTLNHSSKNMQWTLVWRNACPSKP